MSATVLKCTKWRFSSLNQQNFVFIGLVPKSPTHIQDNLCKNPGAEYLKLSPIKGYAVPVLSVLSF
jgi:hypothetical protein